tara:strand:- start:1507 stop:1974 length:468 start_codon:yes stop_codon:yes gene_type:complete
VHNVKLAVGALVTAALGGLFAAVFTYYATVQVNTEASLQQQYLSAIQDFSATGAKVDASITELADTVLDGQGLTDARREARQAIAAHAAASQSLSQVVGQGNVDEYVQGLATLRLLVDDTNGKINALKTSNARFDLMDNRVVMINEARRRVYDRT